MKISIVVSVYNEEQVLLHFYKEIIEVLETIKYEYELLFVNDGSTDNSKNIINSFSINKNVKSINFSTNFGHEAAMIAGIDHATGDAIICMDSDMQHPPALIPLIIKKYQNEKVEIINMVRSKKTINSKSILFYKTLNLISPYNFEQNASDFFLISSKIANILRNEYRERVRFLRGLIQIIGYDKTTIEFDEDKRFAGKSKYSIRKLMSLSFTALASLSKLPLKIGILFGSISALFSIILVIYSLIMKFINHPVSGYTTIIVFLGFMFAIQFILLGIIGQYIGYIFEEQKSRPIYIIQDTLNIKS